MPDLWQRIQSVFYKVCKLEKYLKIIFKYKIIFDQFSDTDIFVLELFQFKTKTMVQKKKNEGKNNFIFSCFMATKMLLHKNNDVKIE